LDEISFSLTRDENIAFVARLARTQSGVTRRLLSARRAANGMEFGAPNENATSAINAIGDVFQISSGADGLTLYISRTTGNQSGLFVATRSDADASFDSGTLATIGNSPARELFAPAISADGQTLYFGDAGFSEVLSAPRIGDATTFGNMRSVAALAMGAGIVSADELTMFFSDSNSVMRNDVFMATRADKTGSFGNRIVVDNVNSAANDVPVAITNDGCVLYISSDRTDGLGGLDIWEAHRRR
jgi:hypothetical protein